MKYSVYELVKDASSTITPPTRKHHKTWIPARPVNYKCDSLVQRFKDAFYVLIGKYDALDWEETKN